jgi:hypothetical protein
VMVKVKVKLKTWENTWVKRRKKMGQKPGNDGRTYKGGSEGHS